MRSVALVSVAVLVAGAGVAVVLAPVGCRSEQLAEGYRVEAARRPALDAVTADLIAGRIDVWAAGDRTAGIIGDNPGHVVYLRKWHPDAKDDRELFARSAAAVALMRFRDDPDGHAEQAARLDAQLAAGRSR